MQTSAEVAAAVVQGAVHLRAGKYFQFASYAVLIYDHMLTFSDEVERIWKQKLSAPAILFLINRYVTPLQFLIILDAFNDPVWTKKAYVTSESRSASTIALIAVCELIMILRVYALYSRNSFVLAFLMTLWTTQIVLSSVGISSGHPVLLPPTFVGCIFTGDTTLFPLVWVAPLTTDCCIFLLTLWRTRMYLAKTSEVPTIHILMRDGVLYFLVISIANLMNTLFFFIGPPDLKAVGASFSQIITSVMISNLVLNLRCLSGETNPPTTISDLRSRSWTRTLGNLGEDFVNPEMAWTFDNDDIDLDRSSSRVPCTQRLSDYSSKTSREGGHG